MAKDAFFSYEITVFRTAWQPDNHSHALGVNLPDFHGLNLVIFYKWKMENWWIWKNDPAIFNSKIQNSFFFIPIGISHQLLGSMDYLDF